MHQHYISATHELICSLKLSIRLQQCKKLHIRTRLALLCSHLAASSLCVIELEHCLPVCFNILPKILHLKSLQQTMSRPRHEQNSLATQPITENAADIVSHLWQSTRPCTGLSDQDDFRSPFQLQANYKLQSTRFQPKLLEHRPPFSPLYAAQLASGPAPHPVLPTCQALTAATLSATYVRGQHHYLEVLLLLL